MRAFLYGGPGHGRLVKLSPKSPCYIVPVLPDTEFSFEAEPTAIDKWPAPPREASYIRIGFANVGDERYELLAWDEEADATPRYFLVEMAAKALRGVLGDEALANA